LKHPINRLAPDQTQGECGLIPRRISADDVPEKLLLRENMNSSNWLGKLIRDENGGEVLEYALIAGLIVVAAVAAIASVGTSVLGRWTSTQNSL
jgi:Flp pilus assembly pilin Flp